MSQDQKPVTLAVGRLRLQFALAVDDLADKLAIPIARIIEVRPDKEVILDKGFIASCLDVRAAPPLTGFLRETGGSAGAPDDRARRTADRRRRRPAGWPRSRTSCS